MNKAVTDQVVCSMPADSEYFDVCGVVGRPLVEDEKSGTLKDPFYGFDFASADELPVRGEQKVLAAYQLHPQYCGMMTYFSQYTDLHARENSQILTPGFEWLILQNGKPVFPYTGLDKIINPWGYNCFPISIRLDENARVEFAIRNRSVRDEQLNWYNTGFGRRIR